jgi:plasmid stabilization system protein ParE
VKRFQVVVPDFVWDQITEQVLYIAQESIDHALAWEVRLKAAILKLAELDGHTHAEEASDRLGCDVRKYVFEGTYLIHYELNEPSGRIEVTGFRHGARLPRRGEP